VERVRDSSSTEADSADSADSSHWTTSLHRDNNLRSTTFFTCSFQHSNCFAYFIFYKDSLVILLHTLQVASAPPPLSVAPTGD
jgi:hypothetical protein